METDKSETDRTEAESSEDEPKMTPRKPHTNKRRSIAWMFCDKENDAIASCKICKLKMSYRSTVTNLTKHARMKHPEFYHRVCEGLKSGNITEGANVTPSTFWDSYDERNRQLEANYQEDVLFEEDSHDISIWRYFNLLDKTLCIASCSICSKRINFSSHTDLLHHLKRKHNDQYIPDKKITLFVTNHDQLFEIETLEDEEDEPLDTTDQDHIQEATNENYDSPTTSDDYKIHKKRVKSLSPQRNNTPQLQIPIKILQEPTTEVPETTLDYFGKYLTSLLKDLPEHVSNKLQVNFVAQAIEAKSMESLPICGKIPGYNIPYTSETVIGNECDVDDNKNI